MPKNPKLKIKMIETSQTIERSLNELSASKRLSELKPYKKIEHDKKRPIPPPKLISPLWIFLIPSGLSTIPNLGNISTISQNKVKVIRAAIE